MKDQKRLLHKCLHNEVPVFVLCGTDACAIQTIETYYQIASDKGCDAVFLDDLKELVEDFKEFKKQEPGEIKLPK